MKCTKTQFDLRGLRREAGGIQEARGLLLCGATAHAWADPAAWTSERRGYPVLERI